MASKNTKTQKAPKSTAQSVIDGDMLEVEATAPAPVQKENPDAADAIANETAVAEAKKTPDEEFDVEYGKVIRERDQTGLLSAILKELFLLRTLRG